MSLMYDPPNGSKYGFPKKYEPLPDEELKDTLLRDDYPQEEIDKGGHKNVRFVGPIAEIQAKFNEDN